MLLFFLHYRFSPGFLGKMGVRMDHSGFGNGLYRWGGIVGDTFRSPISSFCYIPLPRPISKIP